MDDTSKTVQPDGPVERSLARKIVDSLSSLYGGTAGITVNKSHERAALLAHGWYVSVRRNSQAILHLADLRYGHEAAPIVRSTIEHSLGLHWLAEAGDDAVNALLRGHQHSVRRIRDQLTGDWPDFTEYFDSVLDVEISKSHEDHYLAFKHLCERFNFGNLYIAWLLESGLSHPSYSSAVPYIEANDTSMPTTVRAEPEGRSDLPTIVAILLAIASEGFNKLLVGNPWTEALRRIEADAALMS